MKRYDIPVNTIWPQCVNGKTQVYLADETDETIMNMVAEFAETAKEYEAELAKKMEALEKHGKLYNDAQEELAKKDEEIARLRKALEEAGRWLKDADAQIVEYDHGVPYEIIGITKEVIREALGKEGE
jgi:DNA repair exonuclease SbcCD ATPase subunit